MTYGQRERAAARKMAKALAEARARLDAMTPEVRAEVERKAATLRAQLLHQPSPESSGNP